MPRRPDGRIEQGQRLSTAISARAWNRAQDAADIVLGERTGFGAEGRVVNGLPQLTATFNRRGFYGEAVRVSVCNNTSSANLVFFAPSATANVVTDFTWEFSDDEARLPQVGSPIFNVAGGGVTSDPRGLNDVDDTPIAICTENRGLRYAVSGFAITRVRVFNYSHRFAKFATRFIGDTTQQFNDARGCLDSAFYGSVKIVGYAFTNNLQSPPRLQFSHRVRSLTWPNFDYQWALVQL
jgi:hypothetical protein